MLTQQIGVRVELQETFQSSQQFDSDPICFDVAYNRKEAKIHGEGGTVVGAKLAGKVVIIDDVISAGTSVRDPVDMIRATGA